jgi:enamine deaminase RidA (YjgF/YER057c/UK114 family)
MSAFVRSGDYVYVSGQVAFDESNAVVGPGNATAQSEQVFANLCRCLDDAGAGLADLVKLTTYLTSSADYSQYAQVKSRLFDGVVAPASTAVVVKELLHPELLIEVDAIAYLPSVPD